MENLLRSKNLKVTKSRIDILNIINNSNVPLSADDIYSSISKSSSTSKSSVYRILNDFVDLDILIKTLYQDGIYYYEVKTHNHKHYIICEICNSVEEIKTCPVHEYEQEIENLTGFSITDHIIEIKGICPKCKKQ